MDLGRLFTRNKPGISKSQAITIAKEECEKQGWPWQEPVYVQLEPPIFGKRWRVITNSEMRGGNAFITIDRYNGKVIRAGFGPR